MQPGPHGQQTVNATSAGQLTTISQAFFICLNKNACRKEHQLETQAGEKVLDAKNRDDGVHIRTPRSDSEADGALSPDCKSCKL